LIYIQIYLRQWAKDLNAPILSIDYSLAPETPFPRAVEECFFAYAWAVKNCTSLGMYFLLNTFRCKTYMTIVSATISANTCHSCSLGWIPRAINLI